MTWQSILKQSRLQDQRPEFTGSSPPKCPAFGLKGGTGVALATLWPFQGPDRPYAVVAPFSHLREKFRIAPAAPIFRPLLRCLTSLPPARFPPKIPPAAR